MVPSGSAGSWRRTVNLSPALSNRHSPPFQVPTQIVPRRSSYTALMVLTGSAPGRPGWFR